MLESERFARDNLFALGGVHPEMRCGSCQSGGLRLQFKHLSTPDHRELRWLRTRAPTGEAEKGDVSGAVPLTPCIVVFGTEWSSRINIISL